MGVLLVRIRRCCMYFGHGCVFFLFHGVAFSRLLGFNYAFVLGFGICVVSVGMRLRL